MNKNGPVVLIDDDEDDRDFFRMAFKNLKLDNELVRFDNALDALTYLSDPGVTPFVIICDMNMPKMNGLELRDTLFSTPELAKKAVPFVFFTTAANRSTVRAAYKYPIQGIFEKPSSSAELERRIGLMIEYWQNSMLL